MAEDIVFQQVLVLFLVMLVGFYTKKRSIITTEVNQKLSELLLFVTMPFMIIASFHVDFSEEMLRNAGIVFFLAVGVHVFSILIGKLLFWKYPENIKKILRFSAVFSNCGFMGFPIAQGLFGMEGVFYASIYIAVFHIFIWTYGVGLFSGGQDLRNIKKVAKTLVNPGILSVAIGMAIFLLQIRLPEPVFRTIDMVGGITTPLSMLVVGALLADADFKGVMFKLHLYYGVAVRLVLMPVLALAAMRLLGVPDMLLGLMVVLVAMPVAANTAIFAEKYGGDAMLASQFIALSTALSIISIPAIILLL